MIFHEESYISVFHNHESGIHVWCEQKTGPSYLPASVSYT
jgi:hypothetical protein